MYLVKNARYKIDTQKSLVFLYTNNERSEREVKETIPFNITLKKIKYLRINLPKEAKDLYSENSDADDRNQRWNKHMERLTMFLDRRNQHCQSDYTI